MLAGCSTVMHGPTQDILVTSNPSAAIVTATDYGRLVKTPGIITLKRNNSAVLTARLSGYEDAKQEIKSELSLWIFGNGVGSFYGGTVYNWLPMIALTIVDFSTGSAGMLSPTEVHFELVPKKKSTIF